MKATELLNSKIAEPSLLYDYYISHCHKPTKVRIFNHVTEKFETREFPCGKCLHCRATRQNEWVSRLALETDAHAFCYFVTLTYMPTDIYSLIKYSHHEKSIPENSINVKEPKTQEESRELARGLSACYELCSDAERHAIFLHDALQKIHSDKLLRFSSDNSVRRLIERPSLLSTPDLQNFMKRLRKSFDGKIRFFAMGEYGETHFHPHYHLILWTDKSLSRSLISDAWAYKFVNNKGHAIPYRGQKSACINVSLGNIDFRDLRANGTLSGTGNSGDYKLSFTLKYVSKYVTKNQFNDQGLRAAWRDLEKAYAEDAYVDEFSDDDFRYLYGVAISWPNFVRKYRPKGLCSKCPLIGGVYLFRHIDRFTEGSTDLGECLHTKLIYPSAFERKVCQALWPLRISAVVNKCGKEETRSYTISPAQFLRFFGSFASLSLTDPLMRAADLQSAYTFIIRKLAVDGLHRFREMARKETRKGFSTLQDSENCFTSECLSYLQFIDVTAKRRYTFDSMSHGFIIEYTDPKKSAEDYATNYFPEWISLADFCDKYMALASRWLDRQLRRDNQRRVNDEALAEFISRDPESFYDAEREALRMHGEVADCFQQKYKIRHQGLVDNQ